MQLALQVLAALGELAIPHFATKSIFAAADAYSRGVGSEAFQSSLNLLCVSAVHAARRSRACTSPALYIDCHREPLRQGLHVLHGSSVHRVASQQVAARGSLVSSTLWFSYDSAAGM